MQINLTMKKTDVARYKLFQMTHEHNAFELAQKYEDVFRRILTEGCDNNILLFSMLMAYGISFSLAVGNDQNNDIDITNAVTACVLDILLQQCSAEVKE